mmetsp:Transcript_8890/g.22644  ORF Transcript_8890/g.22644 Transcript_8890/m.22644 type:complete len:246 (-) Transcript_8890:394-1131(-)
MTPAHAVALRETPAAGYSRRVLPSVTGSAGGGELLVHAHQHVRRPAEAAHDEEVLVQIGDHQRAREGGGRRQRQLDAEELRLYLLVLLDEHGTRFRLQSREELERVLEGQHAHAQSCLDARLRARDGHRRLAHIDQGRSRGGLRRGGCEAEQRHERGKPGALPAGVEELPLAVQQCRGGGRLGGVQLLELQQQLGDQLAVHVARRGAECERVDPVAQLGDEALLDDAQLVVLAAKHGEGLILERG